MKWTPGLEPHEHKREKSTIWVHCELDLAAIWSVCFVHICVKTAWNYLVLYHVSKHSVTNFDGLATLKVGKIQMKQIHKGLKLHNNIKHDTAS